MKIKHLDRKAHFVSKTVPSEVRISIYFLGFRIVWHIKFVSNDSFCFKIR